MGNEGKRWEKNFKNSLPGIIRLYDTTSGYSGIKNPCDFIYYLYPFQYLIECKSVKDDKLYFSAITDNQHEQLDYYDHIFGITSLVCVEFRKYKKCFAIPYKIIKSLNKSEEKSIYYTSAVERDDIYEIPVTYKITNCVIDEEQFKIIIGRISREI